MRGLIMLTAAFASLNSAVSGFVTVTKHLRASRVESERYKVPPYQRVLSTQKGLSRNPVTNGRGQRVHIHTNPMQRSRNQRKRFVQQIRKSV